MKRRKQKLLSKLAKQGGLKKTIIGKGNGDRKQKDKKRELSRPNRPGGDRSHSRGKPQKRFKKD